MVDVGWPKGLPRRRLDPPPVKDPTRPTGELADCVDCGRHRQCYWAADGKARCLEYHCGEPKQAIR